MIITTLIYSNENLVEAILNYKKKIIIIYNNFIYLAYNRPYFLIFLGAMFILGLFILSCIYGYLGLLPVRDKSFTRDRLSVQITYFLLLIKKRVNIEISRCGI